MPKTPHRLPASVAFRGQMSSHDSTALIHETPRGSWVKVGCARLIYAALSTRDRKEHEYAKNLVSESAAKKYQAIVLVTIVLTMSPLLHPQGRKLPPFSMVEYILDKTAAHMAERAELRDGTSEKFTPHAAKEYEAQRKKSSK